VRLPSWDETRASAGAIGLRLAPGTVEEQQPRHSLLLVVQFGHLASFGDDDSFQREAAR
jgi:hypothetical protein